MIVVRTVQSTARGTICYTARDTIYLLKETFTERLISRNESVDWQPPLDDFLWVYIKSYVYADKTKTIKQFKVNIRRDIAEIHPDLLRKICENLISRVCHVYSCSSGCHMFEIIIFKYLSKKLIS